MEKRNLVFCRMQKFYASQLCIFLPTHFFQCEPMYYLKIFLSELCFLDRTNLEKEQFSFEKCCAMMDFCECTIVLLLRDNTLDVIIK